MKDITQNELDRLNVGDKVKLRHTSKYSDSIVEKKVTVENTEDQWMKFSESKDTHKEYRVCSSSGYIMSFNSHMETSRDLGILKEVEIL